MCRVTVSHRFVPFPRFPLFISLASNKSHHENDSVSHHILRDTLLLAGQTINNILFIWSEATGLFPFASWEEVVSLVQMLFFRSQDGEALSWHTAEEVHANGITTMAPSSPFHEEQCLVCGVFPQTHQRQTCASVAICFSHFYAIFV